MDTNELEQWFSQNVLLILVLGAGLVLFYGYSGRLVHATVRRMLRASEGEFTGSGIEAAELEKRAATIEALATTVIRLVIISLGVIMVIGITGTWNVLVAAGLFIAAITVAGQAIVMDYLMGVFLIIEGTFFKGDNIELGNPPWKGTVEDVGLRRTTVRAVDGTVYSVSNAELRLVANRTRIFAAAEVRIGGIRQGDLARVIEIMERVAREVAADPEQKDAIIEPHTLGFVDDPDALGSVAVLRGKVVASERWRVASVIRIRLDEALAREGIELNRQAVSERAFGGASS